MADKAPASKKNQISLADYLKGKEKRAKSKLQLHFPAMIKIVVGVPIGYLLFLIIYFLIYLRFVAEH